MAQVYVKENESLESALKRFKRLCARDGVMSEIRKREHYEKPSVKIIRPEENISRRPTLYSRSEKYGCKREEAVFRPCSSDMEHTKPAGLFNRT